MIESSTYPSIRVFPSGCQDLDFLIPSIDETFLAVDQFVDRNCDKNRVELPYWTSERATLSLFAGGIWRSSADNLVLEEYCCTKGPTDAPKGGRRDIWFVANGKECYAEAKRADCWREVSSIAVAKIRRWIELAATEADAANSNSKHKSSCTALTANSNETCSSSPYPLGLVFAAPYLIQRAPEEQLSVLQLYWERTLAACEEAHAALGCRLLWARYFRNDLLGPSGYFMSPSARRWLSMPVLDIFVADRGNAD